MYLVSIVTVLILVAADQLTKYLAVLHLRPINNIPLINGVFELTYVENEGAAFGIFQGGKWIFITLTTFVIIGLIYFFINAHKYSTSRWLRISLIFVFAGAVGNYINRLLSGYVVDFLHFSLIEFPVFNLADIFVVCGSFLLCFVLLTSSGEQKTVNDSSAEQKNEE